jgi:hypothetical protein
MRTTARTAPFIPGASPPLVRTAIRFFGAMAERRLILQISADGKFAQQKISKKRNSHPKQVTGRRSIQEVIKVSGFELQFKKYGS